MLLWIGILVAVLLATGLGMAYMTAAVGKYSFVIKLAGESRLKKILIPLGIIILLMIVLSLVFSVANSIVIFLHMMLFFLLYGGIMRIVIAITGKEFKIYWQGHLAVFSCIIYMIIAYLIAHHVVKTEYELTTTKNIEALRIAVFADSHVGTTFDGEGFADHMKEIEDQKPDIVLIPGDFVDDSTKKEDMVRACMALGEMEAKYGVWYSFGNHDAGYYNSRDFSRDELIEELKKNKVHVLEDEVSEIGDLVIVGRKDSGDKERAGISKLLAGVDESKYIIVLDHEPNDYDAEGKSAADLVVSGHTHGGQFFPVTYVGEWIGANDRTYGHEKRNGTDFIVTSGISCWELPFKTGTKSEYVIIDVKYDK